MSRILLVLVFAISLMDATGAAFARDIVVMYALDADFKALRASAEIEPAILKIGEIKAAKFKVGADTIYAAKMGSGLVQSAVGTEALLARFNPDLVLSTGVAGHLTESLAAGDWVEVTSFAAYQMGSQTASGFFPKQQSAAAWRSASESGYTVPSAWSNAARVRAASGELFVSSQAFREELAASFSADVVEMNIAGLAEACANHGVPHYHFRIISDGANEAASEDFMAFVKKYEGAGGELLAEFLKAMPPDKTDPATHGNLETLLQRTSAPAPER